MEGVITEVVIVVVARVGICCGAIVTTGAIIVGVISTDLKSVRINSNRRIVAVRADVS